MNPDAIGDELEAERFPAADGSPGTVPPDNRPGPSSGGDQDKPDLDKFAAKYGIDETDPSGDRAAEAAEAQVAAARDEGGSFLTSTPLRIALGIVGLAVGIEVLRRRRQRPRSRWERIRDGVAERVADGWSEVGHLADHVADMAEHVPERVADRVS